MREKERVDLEFSLDGVSRLEQLPRRLLSQNVAFHRRSESHLHQISRIRLSMAELQVENRIGFLKFPDNTETCIEFQRGSEIVNGPWRR